jgi:uncharacterized OB-fold protein
MRGLGADTHYWDALNNNNLKLQACRQCKKWNWPAVYRCGDCGSWEHDWLPVGMKGEIFTWTRSWHDFGAPKKLGLPFISVVVALEGADNTRLVGVLKTDGEPENNSVAIGKKVQGKIISVDFADEAIPVIQWQLLNEDALATMNEGEGS